MFHVKHCNQEPATALALLLYSWMIDKDGGRSEKTRYTEIVKDKVTCEQLLICTLYTIEANVCSIERMFDFALYTAEL